MKYRGVILTINHNFIQFWRFLCHEDPLKEIIGKQVKL